MFAGPVSMLAPKSTVTTSSISALSDDGRIQPWRSRAHVKPRSREGAKPRSPDKSHDHSMSVAGPTVAGGGRLPQRALASGGAPRAREAGERHV